jgi:putative transposase
MARDNPLWGSERIRGEVLKLGIAVSRRSVQHYRQRGPARPPSQPSQTWRTFLININHRPQLWEADLLTVHTATFRTRYVLLFIVHDRRQLLHVNVTTHPTAAWVWRQLIDATAWGRRPRFLVRDRDRDYGGDFVPRATRLGIETVLTPVRAPRANAVAERVIGTLQWEGLDHVLILNEPHLRAVLAAFVRSSNQQRPHRTLGLETPQPVSRSPTGTLYVRPVLGGLHHTYQRAA